MRGWRPLLVCLLLGPAGWAACGASGAASRSSAPTTRIVAGEAVVGGKAQLTFRPVLEELSITGPPATTPPDEVTRNGTVVLDSRDASGHVTARYQLGPVVLDGRVLGHATARLSEAGQWEVDFVTTKQGSRAFDAMALAEYLHRVAVVLGDLVLTAPQVNAPSFNGTGVITGDFTGPEAKTIAQILDTPD